MVPTDFLKHKKFSRGKNYCMKKPKNSILRIINAVAFGINWRERAAFQRSAFGRSTAGNDVLAVDRQYAGNSLTESKFFLFSVVYFSHRRSARIKKLI